MSPSSWSLGQARGLRGIARLTPSPSGTLSNTPPSKKASELGISDSTAQSGSRLSPAAQ